MLVVNTREFRDSMKKWFDQAASEEVLVKRGAQLFVLKLKNDSQNPHPDNDPYFDNERNLEHIGKSIEQADAGQTITLSADEFKKILFK